MKSGEDQIESSEDGNNRVSEKVEIAPSRTKTKRAKKKAKRKEPVRLREKELRNGNVSLYLDIYWEGVREYDFLELYLSEPISDADRQQNKATYDIAQAIRAQRVLDLQSGKYKLKNPLKGLSFIDYMWSLADERNSSNASNWRSAVQHVEKFTKGKDVSFDDIDATWLINFKLYLSTAKSLPPKKGSLKQKLPAFLFQ